MGTFLTKIQAHLIHLMRFPPDHHSVCIRYRHVESRVGGPPVARAVPFASGSTESVRRGASEQLGPLEAGARERRVLVCLSWRQHPLPSEACGGSRGCRDELRLITKKSVVIER